MDLTYHHLSSAMANPRSPNPNLETLKLNDCGITEEGGAALASARSSKLSHLRELDLSGNKLDDFAIMILCAGLGKFFPELETLKMNDCGIAYEGCEALASALRNTSDLRELDLSMNSLGCPEMIVLSAGLSNPHCKLEKLKLVSCVLTYEGCEALARALTNNSHLRELDLSMNSLSCPEMIVLSAGLSNPHCKLEKLKLVSCALTYEGCEALARALTNNSYLRELDLSKNRLGCPEMIVLSAGLSNPHCKLEKLKLVSCALTYEGCEALASALTSNPSHLRELDLSMNSLGCPEMIVLSAGLSNPHCKLEKLKLVNCSFTNEGYAALMSALRSNPSHLRKLDLSKNDIDYLDMMLLSSAMENPYWKLETLKLKHCGVTDQICASVTSALRSNPSHLRELDLSENKLGDFEVQMLSTVLEMPYCKLQKLKLVSCDITDSGCVTLASALRSIGNMDLSGNKLGHFGIKHLSDALASPYCKLETLKLVSCGVIDKGCAALASALTSVSSTLRELDLSKNKLSDSGMKLLFAGLEDPHCKLEVLRLNDCEVSHEGCAALASFLTSNPSHLRELDLSDNKLGDSGVKMLCTGLGDPRCKLEILKLKNCGFTDKGCAALASVLGSIHSYLKYVDLSGNTFGNLGVQLLFDVCYYTFLM